MKSCRTDTSEAPRHLRTDSSSWIPVGINTEMTKDGARKKGEQYFGIEGYRKFREEWDEIRKNMRRDTDGRKKRNAGGAV